MKKRNIKKIIIGIILFVIILFGMIVAAGFISGKIYIEKYEDGTWSIVIDDTVGEKSTTEKIAEAIQTTHPTTLFVYGEDCAFSSFVKYRQIPILTEDNLESSDEKKVIIINDMHGETVLTDNDYDLLKKYVLEGNYSLIYIGKERLSEFVEREFIDNQFQEADRGFSIRNYGGHGVKTVGFWQDDSQEYFDNGSKNLLEDIIMVCVIQDLIRGE